MQQIPVLILLNISVAAPTLQGVAANTYGKVRVGFEENRGQAPHGAEFLTRVPGYTFLLAAAEATLIPNKVGLSTPVHIKLAGANRNAVAERLQPLEGKTNYLIGPDPRYWIVGSSRYARVQYREVYPGIDIVYHGTRGQIEYDFEIAPGADSNSIRLRFDGMKRIDLRPNGDLAIDTPGGQFVQHRPCVYQRVRGRTVQIASSYVRHGAAEFTFDIGPYDHTVPLVIDPAFSFSTLLGGSAEDAVNALAVDSAGNAYVAGTTASRDFPAKLVSQASASRPVSFVLKLNSSGTDILYATYLENASVSDIALDSTGNLYLTGNADRNFVTTPGAFQPGGGGAFVAKLNSTGSQFVYSTFLATATVSGLAIDTGGNAYLTGTAGPEDFPTTPGAFQTKASSSSDAFVIKLNSAGSGLTYSTYLGGRDPDRAFGIAVDSAGNAYITGTTSSPDFPTTPAAFQRTMPVVTPGREDAFVTKVNASGSALMYSTFLGGTDRDWGSSVAVDSSGNAYVTGSTCSEDFPVTRGIFQSQWGGDSCFVPSDAFVTKLSASGSALIYSTYVGGSSIDSGRKIAVDVSGNAVVAGSSRSYNFPTTIEAYQRCRSEAIDDLFVSVLNGSGSALIYSTYIGGDSAGSTRLGGIAVNAAGHLYVAGVTGSSSFPVTPGAFQTTRGGRFSDSDGFVFRIDLSAPAPMSISCVANAASYISRGVAPGEIVTIFGVGLGPVSGVGARLNEAGRLDTSLGETRVLFDGIPSPLIYAQSSQVSAITPFNLAGKEATVMEVVYRGTRLATTLAVTAVSPGIFSLNSAGFGPGAILNEDGTLNSRSNPARSDSIVVLFATGAGQTDPPGVDGRVASGPLKRPLLPVKIRLGSTGVDQDVLYAGSAPGLVEGIVQVNFRVPRFSSPIPDLPVVLRVGDSLIHQTTVTMSTAP